MEELGSGRGNTCVDWRYLNSRYVSLGILAILHFPMATHCVSSYTTLTSGPQGQSHLSALLPLNSGAGRPLGRLLTAAQRAQTSITPQLPVLFLRPSSLVGMEQIMSLLSVPSPHPHYNLSSQREGVAVITVSLLPGAIPGR